MDPRKEREFQRRLLATFRLEAEEHLGEISRGLLQLEKSQDSEDSAGLLEHIYREAHSLKGASRAVNQHQFEAFCKAMEDVFNLVKNRELVLTPEGFDVIFQSLDLMNVALKAIAEKGSTDPASMTDLAESFRKIESLGQNMPDQESNSSRTDPHQNISPVQDEMPIPAELATAKDTVRIPVSKLEAILNQSEELISLRLRMNQHAQRLKAQGSRLTEMKNFIDQQELVPQHETVSLTVADDQQARVTAKQGILRTQRTRLEAHRQIRDAINGMKDLETEFLQDRKMAASDFKGLITSVRDLLMLPFQSMLDVFPKLVRDLSHDQGKAVELHIHGAEQEIDRRILEQLKDPLIHIIRNCIDHGIEKPEDRKLAGKAESGRINIQIAPLRSNWIELRITDDGRGIDFRAVGKKAVQTKLLTEKELEGLPEEDLQQYLYQSGFSTAGMITNISGRGLGMTIVREKVEQIGGNLHIESRSNEGTSIIMNLPLAFGTFRGLAVMIGDQQFILPTRHIETVQRIPAGKIASIENKDVISHQQETLNVVDLKGLLGISGNSNEVESELLNVLILKSGPRKLAAIVQAVVQEQEILIKPFEAPIKRLRFFDGITLLGSGVIAPVMNVHDILRSVESGLSSGMRRKEKAAREISAPSILVAEDSMTARMLMKDILESAGYEVKTANDGAEALQQLEAGDFQLLVSDIEMPHVDGFELTGSIRKNEKLMDLPVILVTALQTQADRERGLEVGANAYIEKGDFEPEELLNTIRKLI